MDIMEITGAVREQTGKTHSRTDRRENKIPCVLYGGEQVKYFTVGELEVYDLVYTPDFKVAQIELNGSKHRCIVKDIQFHPLTDEIQHIDFMELVDGKEIKVEIPLRLRGAAPGVKSGGNLIHKMRKVSVKAKPENLVDELCWKVFSHEMLRCPPETRWRCPR